MKQYTISTGAKLRYDRGAYVARVDWCGKELFTVFTPDEGVSDVSADAAVALFEKIYARKEYYMMLVRLSKPSLSKSFPMRNTGTMCSVSKKTERRPSTVCLRRQNRNCSRWGTRGKYPWTCMITRGTWDINSSAPQKTALRSLSSSKNFESFF